MSSLCVGILWYLLVCWSIYYCCTVVSPNVAAADIYWFTDVVLLLYRSLRPRSKYQMITESPGACRHILRTSADDRSLRVILIWRSVAAHVGLQVEHVHWNHNHNNDCCITHCHDILLSFFCLRVSVILLSKMSHLLDITVIILHCIVWYGMVWHGIVS